MIRNQPPRFEDLIIPNATLPSMVLRRSFDKYLFFDADMGSSVEIIAAIRDVISQCFNGESEALIFNSRRESLLAILAADADWSLEVSRVGKAMRNAGDSDGLALVDTKGRWVAYQYWPVDIGIFALTCQADLATIPELKDNFFDKADITNWLCGQSPRDTELTQSLGADFLAKLLQNYST